MVTSHGGPTSAASTSLELRTQFWTSRGFALVDVDYPADKDTADGTDDVDYITAKVFEVQARLEQVFADEGITYQTAEVGPFHIYYDFSPRVPRPPLPLAG